MKYQVTLSFFLLCATMLLRAQDTVVINLTVTDKDTRAALSGVSVINPATITTATDARGKATVIAFKGDILFLFYPGYKTAKFSVVDSALKKQYNLDFGLEPLTAGLSQPVVIKAPKTLEEIEAERKKLGETPKELDKPIIQPFSSPISALYDVLSRRAREREKLKQQIVEDERRRIFKELFRYYNENGLMDLPEEHYESFINFCNLDIDFLKYSSDYEITKTIITLYNKYGRLNGIIK